MKLISTLGILFAFLALCSCQGRSTQNPPTQIDTERQAKIEDALKDLKDKDAYVRLRAVAVLRQLGAKEYAKDIAGLLKDEDADVRSDAVWALGYFGAKEYAKDVAGLLKDEDAYVRGNAVSALGCLGAKEYAGEIRKLISDLSKCYTWDWAEKNFTETTVSAEAERMLKEWKQLPADGEQKTENKK